METATLEINTKPEIFEGYETTVHNGEHYISVEDLCDMVKKEVRRAYEND